ncbi:MAG: glycosyltransferase family 4 protein [Clostridia bacterium]|nr:glycosyltransferase family 4 protein [Clostridia bacterium]
MIVFFSNFINEHQIPFCNAMYEKTGGQFRFVATEPISEERLRLGFVDRTGEFPYVVKTYEEEGREEALRLGRESDVVIIGSAPDEYVKDRLAENKLTFRYWERFFKNGRWHILDPRVVLQSWRLHTRYRKKNLYMLCASAYTAPDCRFIFAYPNKTYKWGYFPQVKKYESVDALLESKQKNTILWVGRMIDWKHPEAAPKIAKRLRDEGYEFQMDLIGTGAMESDLKNFIAQNNLSDRVRLLGAMPPEKVRCHMEQSEIYLFTSDRGEGWGAVLNESMNSACADVASGDIGSVPYLIKDGENGLIYRDGDLDDLYEKVKYLLDHPKERAAMGKAAYQTMTDLWCADVAAERLLTLIETLQTGKDTPYADGPCSKD